MWTKKSSDKNRLTHEQAILVLEKSGYTPLEPYKSAISKWKCLHKQCGTIVEVRYSQINFGAGGCKKCGYLNSAEKNRIPEKEAINLMLDAGLQPLEAYKSSTSKWKCLHIACGKIVQPQLADIKQGRGGCRFCGKAGLNYNEPAQLYLMTNQYYESIKIGVTNISSVTKRISAHKKEGWSVFRVKQFESGDAAYNVEQSVLKWLRMDLKLPYHLAPEQMPQRGWTETVDADEIEVTTIWNKVIEISRNLAYREIERS